MVRMEHGLQILLQRFALSVQGEMVAGGWGALRNMGEMATLKLMYSFSNLNMCRL